MELRETTEERTPEPPVDLEEVGRSLLDEAQGNGRAAVTLTPSTGGPLKQTLLALTEGAELSEHTAPGPATIHVLRGTARLRSEVGDAELAEGSWAPLPRDRHSLHAVVDMVALLTVVPNP